MKAAAEALNVGLPTISKQLSDLEVRLGMRLCNRGGSKFELTADGAEVYRASTELLSSIENFRNNVGKLKKKNEELLRIAAIDNIITARNSPLLWLISYLDARNCRVSVIVLQPDQIEKGVRENIFDIGITPIYCQDPELIYTALYEEVSYLYCGDRHPIFTASDEELDCRMVDAQPCVEHLYIDKRFVPAHKNSGNDGAVALQLEAVLTLILSGKYLGSLTGHFASAFEERHQIRKVQEDRHKYSTGIGFVYRRDGVLSSTVLQVIDLLRNRCVEEPGDLPVVYEYY